MSPADAPMPLTPNVVCIDYSAGRTGPAVAYRWDGEEKANFNKFVTSDDRSFPQVPSYERNMQPDLPLVKCLN
jgi:hypothetical protein